MGYTHYWDHGKVDPETFKAFAEDVRKIIAASGVPVQYEYDNSDEPVLTAELVRFNGVGEDGHETFYMTPEGTGFSFCKTARKPYDVIVTASLIAAKNRFPISVRSDGDFADWEEGETLAHKALGSDLPTIPAVLS